MLTAIGYQIDFQFASEKWIWTRPGVAMLYDSTGRIWPACSLLFSTFDHAGKRAELDTEARWFFGKGYRPKLGSVALPTKDLTDWDRVGPVHEINYQRPGTRAPGHFFHLFGKRRWENFFRKGKIPILWSRERLFRLELHRGCRVDDRGIVSP